MKKTIIAIAATLLVAGAAQAESSVTLYGLVDAGITYVNNQGGHSNIKMDTGVMNGNRWGLRGREDLSEGLAAIFRVESGFALDKGTSGQGGRLFGRQAFAGLDIKDVGQVTLGRQYDFMGDIGDYTIAGNQFGGVYMLESSGVFHNDAGLGSGATGRRVDNSVKFQSANLGGSGLNAGAMIGLGEKAADKKAGRALSASLGYDGVPGLSTKVAYTQIRDAVVSSNKVQNIGVGASYDFGMGKVNGVFTNTKANVGAANGKANVYEVGYTHRFTPQVSAGVGYQYFDNKTVGEKKDDIHGVSLAADYAFSKRTDAYALAVFNKGKGNTTGDIDITGSGPSDKKNQMALRVGLRHKF
jgi:general bacterial porin, GBP family